MSNTSVVSFIFNKFSFLEKRKKEKLILMSNVNDSLLMKKFRKIGEGIIGNLAIFMASSSLSCPLTDILLF